MGYFTVSNLFILILVGMANGNTCNGPNGKPLCLEPQCIRTTGDVLRVMDLDADPCQDFYQYACGNFAEVTMRPDSESRNTPFKVTQRQNRKVVQKLLEADGNEYRGVRSEALVKAKTFFKTCMNQTFEVERGIDNFLELVHSVGLLDDSSVPTPPVSYLAKIYQLGIQLLFAMNVGPDDKNSSVNVFHFQQFGLNLYHPSFYEGDTSRLDAFTEQGVTILTLLLESSAGMEPDQSEAEARSRMDGIVEFEGEMSKIYVPSAKLQDSESIYNKMTLQQLADMMPDFDLLGYITEVFGRDLGGDREAVVYTPAYFRKLNNLIRDTPARVLEDYSLLSMTRKFLKYLTKPFRDAELEFVRVLTGATERPTLLEQCIQETDRNFGMVTGALFVEQKSSEEAKRKTEEILQYIRDTFVENLPQVSWMDSKAKSLSKEKVQAMTTKIGFPDFILDPALLDALYEGFDVVSDSALQNHVNYKTYLYKNSLKIVDAPVDKTKWDLSPGKVAATYDHSRNELAFPSGILQPPFFSTDLPTSMVFGAIGTIMAHELTHGFDTQGRLYDKYGRLRSWLWGKAAYNEKTDCLVRQYSQYLIGGQNVDGTKTLDENIADNGGLKIAFLAYQKWRRDNEDGFELPLNLTANQEFFLGLGQAWCSDYTPQSALNFLQTDTHAPERYRVIGMVSNLPGFSEAFRCAADTPMNPAEKCEVW
ncbi:endothelin-converting enzyme 1-like [Patiria miniata]|uniref:Endothelin-converting enzyme 1 n=1 Tax=Patiria miniata TaxID=46514 RepID=A0A913ZG06_PATMI|nr:endothelin-converting enzyme 1-like [Patiria miniata]